MGPRVTSILRALRRRVDGGSLKLRITLGGIAALTLGIGLITVLLVHRAERDVLQAQRQRELTEAVRTAAVLSRRVVELQRALRAVAAQLDPETLADEAALTRFVEAQPVLRGMFNTVFLAGADGRMRLMADEAGLRRPTLDVSDRPYFRRTVSEARPIVSEPLPSRMSGEPVVIFTHPVSNAAGVYAVLGGALRLANRDLLADLVDLQEADAQTLLVVTDEQGRVLAHPDRTRLLQPLADDARLTQAFNGWVSAGRAIEPAGLSLTQRGEVASAAGVAGPDWMVWRVRSEAELLAPLQKARREALLWAAGVIALLSLALLAFLRGLLRPLSLLEQRAQHLFDGTLDAQAGWPVASGEIGRLGRVLRRVGTERAQLELMNSEVLRKLGSVMSAAPMGLALTRERRFELVSAEFCRLFGRAEAELVGQPAWIIYASPQDYAALGPQVLEAFQADRPYVGEWQMQRADGTLFWASLRGQPADRHDPGAGTIWTLSDIGEQRLAREQLEWSATHDPLTGLANRKSLEQRAARLVAAVPLALPAALVFIDLDHFKPINDSAGHAAGDAMLRAVADAMSTCVRATDLVVRLGGDEFALLLERCSPHAALRVAEDVRDAITALVLPWEQHRLTVGASLGVANLGPGTAGVAAWVEAADAACYASKAAGRGTVRVATATAAAPRAAVPVSADPA